MNLIYPAWACQKPQEIIDAATYLAAQKPVRILEIGTERGGTTFVWAQCLKDVPEASILTIDHREWDWIYKGAPFEKKITQMIADSHLADTYGKVKSFFTDPIDFLFIDGDHTYEGVKFDFEIYAPLVRKGGVIGFHDILQTYKQEPIGNWLTPLQRNDEIQVSALWEQLRLKHENISFIQPTILQYMFWGGIGFLTNWKGV